METKTILLLGRPGSGKSTQFELLRAMLPGALFLSFGTLARDFMQGDSHAARRAKALLEQGKMLPAFLSTALWAPYLFEHLAPGQNVVIEGAPRHLFEAESLDSFLSFYERPKPILVLNLEIPEQSAVDRLTSRGEVEGRIDDTKLESIRNRQGWYAKETEPVLEWLRANENYRVIDIDGTASPEVVQETIAQAIG